MDAILALLIEAFGEQQGRLIWGAYRLAQTAVATAAPKVKAPEDPAPPEQKEAS